jgi:hypothetical protein
LSYHEWPSPFKISINTWVPWCDTPRLVANSNRLRSPQSIPRICSTGSNSTRVQLGITRA